MKELVTDAQFSVWFGVACALWTGVWAAWAGIARRRSGFTAAVAGPVAYLLWMAYGTVVPVLDITRVSGVLLLTALFVAVGCGFGWWLARGWARDRNQA